MVFLKVMRILARGIALAALLGLLVVAARCSFLVAPNAQQCRNDDDCLSRGEAFAGSTCVDNLCWAPTTPDAEVPTDVPIEVPLPPGWECVGNLRTPPPAKPLVQLTITLSDLIHPTTPVADAVVVRICRRLDVDCKSPLSATFHPDLSGRAQFMVDAPFDGYVEVLPAVDPPLYAPTLLFFNSAVVDDLIYTPTGLLATADLPMLIAATGAGTMADDRYGAILFRAADCSRVPAAEIMFSVDLQVPETHRFYILHGFPSQNTPSTDTSGLGGFINLPMGIRNITATRMADGLQVASTGVLVRPRYFTYSILAPFPLLPP
jgi:hypothetical protein